MAAITGQFAREIGRDPAGLNVGDIEVEMQFFTRRRGQDGDRGRG